MKCMPHLLHSIKVSIKFTASNFVSGLCLETTRRAFPTQQKPNLPTTPKLGFGLLLHDLCQCVQCSHLAFREPTRAEERLEIFMLQNWPDRARQWFHFSVRMRAGSSRPSADISFLSVISFAKMGADSILLANPIEQATARAPLRQDHQPDWPIFQSSTVLEYQPAEQSLRCARMKRDRATTA